MCVRMRLRLKPERDLQQEAEEWEQRQRIADLEEAQLMVDNHYKSIEEEVEVKSEKLKRLTAIMCGHGQRSRT